MKIKQGDPVVSDDFWYDLTDGGYIVPEELLEDAADVERVNEALKTLNEFREALEQSGRYEVM
jgi:hypothetical protein